MGYAAAALVPQTFSGLADCRAAAGCTITTADNVGHVYAETPIVFDPNGPGLSPPPCCLALFGLPARSTVTISGHGLRAMWSQSGAVPDRGRTPAGVRRSRRSQAPRMAPASCTPLRSSLR